MWKTPSFNKGNRPSASKLQHLSDMVGLLSNSLSANGNTSSCGILSAETLPESFWVRVLGNDGGDPPAHYWQQVLDTDEEDGVADKEDGLAGDPDSMPLYDVNGSTIPDGTVLRVYRGLGDWYYTEAIQTRGIIELNSSHPQEIILANKTGIPLGFSATRKEWQSENGTWNVSYSIWCVFTDNSSYIRQLIPGLQYEAFLLGRDENGKEVWGVNEPETICFFKCSYSLESIPSEAEWLGRIVRGCSNDALGTEITSPEDTFSSEDVGKKINYPYFTGTITTISSPTKCTVSGSIPYANSDGSLTISSGKTIKAWPGSGYDSYQSEGSDFFKPTNGGFLYFANGEYPKFDKYYLASRCGETYLGETVWAAEAADIAFAQVTSLSHNNIFYSIGNAYAYPCKVNDAGQANGWLQFENLGDGDQPVLGTKYLCVYSNHHAALSDGSLEFPLYETYFPSAASENNWGVVTTQAQTLKGDKTLLGSLVAKGNISATGGTLPVKINATPDTLGWVTGDYLSVNGDEIFGGYANLNGKPYDNAVVFIGGNTIYPNGGIYNLANPDGDSVDPRVIDVPDPTFLAICGPSNAAYGSYAAAMVGVGRNNIIFNGGCNFGQNEDGTIVYEPPMQPGIFIASGGKQVECATGVDSVGNYFVSGLCVSVGGTGGAAGNGGGSSSGGGASASLDDGSFW